MKKHFKNLTASKFIRNVAIVAMGTAGAQAISMIFMPIITRLYGPEAFGQMGTFMAIVAILTPMAALTYPIAIVLPRKDSEALGIAKLSLGIAFTISALIAILILFFGDWFTVKFNAEEISPYLLLIPISMLFSASQQVLSQWLIRLNHFRVTAKVAVVQAFLLNSTKAGIGVFYPSAAVLIVLQTISSVLYTLLLWLGAKTSYQVNKDKDKVSLKELAYRYRDFAIFRAPQVTLNAASQSLPVLMLATFFGPVSAGFYTLGRTIMGIPSALLGKSVGDVFYPRISEAEKNKELLYPLIKKATLLLGIIGFLPFLIVILFGPWLFAFVFGADWAMAGEYARWLSAWIFFMFLNSPSIQVLPILKAQGYHLAFTCVTIITRLSVLYIGYAFYSSDLIAVMLFGVSGAILNAILILGILIMCKKHDKGMVVNG